MEDAIRKEYLGGVAAVFKITNLINEKIYIGCSHDIYDANFDKVKYRQKNLLNDIEELGEENFDFEILVICEPKQVFKYCQKYIDKYDAVNKGYNLVSYNTRRPVIVINCYDLDDYKYYDCAKDAAADLNVSVESVMDVIYGEKKTIKEKIIRLLDQDGAAIENDIDINEIIKEKRKNAIFFNGRWCSLKELSRTYRIGVDTIRRRLEKGMTIEAALNK